MKAIGRYDSALQMFVEDERELDYRILEFLRWMFQRGDLADDTSSQITNDQD